MASLLLGFFAVASPSPTPRFLSSLRLVSYAPLVAAIQEFLLLQSDSCTLQQEGLETTFRMVDQLKRIDAAATRDHETETARTVEPLTKRPRLEPSALPVATSPQVAVSGSTFDQLFSQQPRRK